MVSWPIQKTSKGSLQHCVMNSGYLVYTLNMPNRNADLLTVKTLVAASLNHTIGVVYENTDLLVLLCFHTSLNKFNIYFRPDLKPSAKKCEDL